MGAVHGGSRMSGAEEAPQGDRAARERRRNNLSVQGATGVALILIAHGTALAYGLSGQGQGPATMIAGFAALGCATWALTSVRMARREWPVHQGAAARGSCLMAFIAQASCTMIGSLQDAGLFGQWAWTTGLAAIFVLLAMIPWASGEASLAKEQRIEDAHLAQQASLRARAEEEAQRLLQRQRQKKIDIRYGQS